MRVLVFICASLTVFAQFSQLQKAPSPPAGKGSIEGVVADTSKEPIRKVQVTLGGSLPTPLTAVTDDSGRFAFRDLPAGNYWLTPSKAGFNPPKQTIGSEANVGVMVGVDEHKKDMDLVLVPAGTIRGHVVNEDGSPISGCMLSAVDAGLSHNRQRFATGSGAANNKGEYRIQNLEPGRYYVFAHCQAELPAPHPLMPRGDPRIPHDTYRPQFYGGGLDPATATKFAITPGGVVEGIDFRMTRIPAFTLQGTVTGNESAGGNVQIVLLPSNPNMREMMRMHAGLNPQSHKFEIHSVIPGSYLLVASTNRDGVWAGAQRAVEVGAQPPEPLEISLSGHPALEGSVQFDCDDHPPVEKSPVSLIPIEGTAYSPQSQAQVDGEGKFVLNGILPGHYRVMVAASGYLKSVTLGTQEVSPYNLEIASGTAGPLRIAMGCKLGELSVTVKGATSDHQVSILMFPEDLERLGSGLERVGSIQGSSQIELGGLPPGSYRLFATDLQNPWPILERRDLLKALDSQVSTVEITEGSHTRITVEMISREDLMRLAEDKQ